MKTCPACGISGVIEEMFGRRRPGGPANSYCRSCVAERSRKWYAANKDRPRPPVDKSKARIRNQKYVGANRELINARTRARDAANPEARRERVRRRRARLRGATTERVNYAAILAKHGHVCHICGGDIEGAIDFDHVIPIARGGAHAHSNIKPSHPSCNRRKGARIALATRQALTREEAA